MVQPLCFGRVWEWDAVLSLAWGARPFVSPNVLGFLHIVLSSRLFINKQRPPDVFSALPFAFNRIKKGGGRQMSAFFMWLTIIPLIIIALSSLCVMVRVAFELWQMDDDWEVVIILVCVLWLICSLPAWGLFEFITTR